MFEFIGRGVRCRLVGLLLAAGEAAVDQGAGDSGRFRQVTKPRDRLVEQFVAMLTVTATRDPQTTTLLAALASGDDRHRPGTRRHGPGMTGRRRGTLVL